MALSETNVAATWLYGTLSGDSALAAAAPGGVWEDLAPDGTAQPFVIFHIESDTDLVVTGAVRIWSAQSATVKVVAATGSFLALEAAAKRVDELLDAKSGDVSGGTVVSCIRNMPVRYVETADEAGAAVVYRHLGGEYSLQVQSK